MKINLKFTKNIVIGTVFSLENINITPGFISVIIKGKNVKNLFLFEAGKYTIQRVPPTEHKGRRQTSTITVAVLDQASFQKKDIDIPEKDLVWKMCRGSGNGGQKRNKTSSVVQLTHLPTKIMIRCEQGRSQSVNKEIAHQNLKDKLIAIDKGNFDKTLKRDRREQIGDGQRGDKIRTISFLYDNVTDHRTGKRISIDRFSKGFLEELNYESHEERKNQESC